MLNDKTVDQLIEQFGGLRPMAKALNVPVPTVQGWKKRGRVPPEHHAAVVAQLALLSDSKDDKPTVKPTITPVPPAAKLNEQSQLRQHMLATPHQSASYWVWLGVASLVGVIVAFLILVLLFFAPNLRSWLLPELAAHTPTNTPTATWLARLDTLETQLEDLNDNDIARAKALATLQKTRMSLTAHSPDANANIKDLQAQVAALQTQLKAINQQKQDNSLLKRLAERDSRAATLLVVATKLQQIFQNQAPFVAELSGLKALLADFPTLQAALDKLEPFAEQGLPNVPHIQADIQRRAMDYQLSQQKDTPQDEASWLTNVQNFSQRFVTIKKDDKVLVGEAAPLPSAVPQALASLQQNNVADSLRALQALPSDWQTALAPSVRALQGRLAAQNLLNQVWRASAKLVRHQE